MNIQLTPSAATVEDDSKAGPQPAQRSSSNGHEASFRRNRFLGLLDILYPTGLQDVNFLDCGCNAGAYCFWARERNVKQAYGFDVRARWIKQALFVQHQRTIAPTDRIQFETRSVFDLRQDNKQFELVLFRGLFQHLSDPIGGLKIAADAATDILVFSTVFRAGIDDESLKLRMNRTCNSEHGGVEGLSWTPSGPKPCISLLKRFGFHHLKIIGYRLIPSDQRRKPMGRVEIVAARDSVRLNEIDGRSV